MKEVSERTSRLTRQSSGNRQSGRSSSGRSNRRSLSASERRSSSANEQVTNARKRKRDVEDTNLAKKSNAPVPDAIPKIPSRIIGGKKIDAYCWICHKPVQDDEFCCLDGDCPRIYHKKCHKKIKTNPSEPLCECKWTSIDGIKSQIPALSDLKEILSSVLHKVVHEKNNKKTQSRNQYLKNINSWPKLPENDLLTAILDIRVLVDRIHLCFYESTGQFFQDVKWIYHNCYVTKGPDHEMTITAQKFEKAIKQQLSDVEACEECYLEKSSLYPQIDFFTRLCFNPHPIVWAKLKGFPFWPAKCLRIVNGHADVRFFGTHDKSLVPLVQVFKMSRRNPGGNPKKSKNSSRMTSYEEAMIELSHYISNYENQYGSFQYCSEKTPLEAVKKTGRKTRQSKNGNQLDTSLNADSSGCNDTSNNQSPHLNISLLHEDVSETKAVFHSPSVAMGDFTERNNENLAENAMESSVLCHMTFDEETPGEMNIVDEVVESASQIHPQLPEISNQVSVTSIKSCPQLCINESSSQLLLNNTETTQSNSDSNIIISDNLSSEPSSSTSPPLLITSTHSLSDVLSDSINEISKMNITNNGVFSNEHIKKLLNIADNCTQPEAYSVDDDEIEVVNETRGKSTADHILKSKALTKTVCELLMGNRPNLRSYLLSFQKMAMRSYLSMWLEVNSTRLNTSDMKAFNVLYETLTKKFAKLKSYHSKLKKENADLKQKLEAREKRVKMRAEIIKLHDLKTMGNTILYKREVKKLKKEVDEMKNSYKRVCKELDEKKTSFSISTSSHQNKVNHLESLLKEKDEKLTGQEEFYEKLEKFNKQQNELEEKIRVFENQKKVFEDQKRIFEEEKEVFEEEKEAFEAVKKEFEGEKKEFEEEKEDYVFNSTEFGSQVDNFLKETEKLKKELKDKDTEIMRLNKIISEKESIVRTDVHGQTDVSPEGNLCNTSGSNQSMALPSTSHHVESQYYKQNSVVRYYLNMPAQLLMPNSDMCVSPPVNTSSFITPSVIQSPSSYPLPPVNSSSHIMNTFSSSESSVSQISKFTSSKATNKEGSSYHDVKFSSEVKKEVKKTVSKSSKKRK